MHAPPLPADDLLLRVARYATCFDEVIWSCTRTFGNLVFTRRGVEQLGSSLGS